MTFDSEPLYGVEKIGDNQELTNDGFLICRNVPIARLGTLLYSEKELPDCVPGPSGIIYVDRREEDVFHPDAIASFNGKPVTDSHPSDLISPDSWKESKAIGTTINPRRGTGVDADVLLADLLIYDYDAIELIRSKKRTELSCGYTSDYEQDEPGRAVQRNIRGNHVALVKQGRCGPRCAIKDHEVMARKKIGFKDLLTIYRKAASDEDLLESMIASPKGEDDETAGAGTHIHLHGLVSAGGPSSVEEPVNKDEEKEEDPYEARFKSVEDSIKGLRDSIEEMKKPPAENTDRKVKDESEEEEEEEEAEKKENKDRKVKDESEEEEEKKEENKDAEGVEEEGEEKEKKGETKDSMSLKAAWADTVARAEKLAPGLKSPTFDSKNAKVVTKKSLCSFRRRALAAAFQDAAMADVVKKYIPSRQSASKLPCSAVRVAFMAASDAAGALNNLRHRGSGADGTPASRTNDMIRQMNENNRKAWNLGN